MTYRENVMFALVAIGHEALDDMADGRSARESVEQAIASADIPRVVPADWLELVARPALVDALTVAVLRYRRSASGLREHLWRALGEHNVAIDLMGPRAGDHWLDWSCERGGVTFLDPLPNRPERYGWLEVITWSPIPPYQMTDDYVFDL